VPGLTGFFRDAAGVRAAGGVDPIFPERSMHAAIASPISLLFVTALLSMSPPYAPNAKPPGMCQSPRSCSGSAPVQPSSKIGGISQLWTDSAERRKRKYSRKISQARHDS